MRGVTGLSSDQGSGDGVDFLDNLIKYLITNPDVMNRDLLTNRGAKANSSSDNDK